MAGIGTTFGGLVPVLEPDDVIDSLELTFGGLVPVLEPDLIDLLGCTCEPNEPEDVIDMPGTTSFEPFDDPDECVAEINLSKLSSSGVVAQCSDNCCFSMGRFVAAMVTMASSHEQLHGRLGMGP
mmetsp:Transcript_137138/g.273565  ORF Transcript_137138/g.273565 Transcript_137138/m.273565 type:complete len:125 (-) Transcript_137138:2-376(-)